MTRDDSERDPIPAPDSPATTGEKTRAEGFARLIDKLVDGEPLPPAMEADDRALIEVATIISASMRDRELSAERRRQLVDQALERAVLGVRPAAETAGPKRPGISQPPPVPISRVAPAERAPTVERRESRLARALPWTVAFVAAAAAIVLFVTRPAVTPTESAPAATALELDAIHRSRPADPLIGRISKERSGEASARMDTIYADRLAGYRDLMFRRQLGGKL